VQLSFQQFEEKLVKELSVMYFFTGTEEFLVVYQFSERIKKEQWFMRCSLSKLFPHKHLVNSLDQFFPFHGVNYLELHWRRFYVNWTLLT